LEEENTAIPYGKYQIRKKKSKFTKSITINAEIYGKI